MQRFYSLKAPNLSAMPDFSEYCRRAAQTHQCMTSEYRESDLKLDLLNGRYHSSCAALRELERPFKCWAAANERESADRCGGAVPGLAKHTTVVWQSGNGQPFYNPQHFCVIYSLNASIPSFNDGSVWYHVVQDRPCLSEPDILGKLEVFEGEIWECVSVVMWMDTVRCRAAAALLHTLLYIIVHFWKKN